MGTKTLDGKGFFKLRKSLMRSVVVSVQHKSDTRTYGRTVGQADKKALTYFAVRTLNPVFSVRGN